MDKKYTVKVSDFSITPGARKKEEGKSSGEEFRDEFLKPYFEKALAQNKQLVVNLDGTMGYGTSWLEEVFGGLTRRYDKDKVLKTLTFISKEQPKLIPYVKKYIENAKG